MPDALLENYRKHYEDLRKHGVPRLRAMESARKYYPHPLTKVTPGLVEVNNRMIKRFGAEDVFREAYRHLKAQAESREIKEIYMMVGPPGSGKSVYVPKLLAEGRVVFDAASCRRGARTAAINIAKKQGKPIHAVYLTTPLETCIFRNAKRHDDLRVQPAAIFKAHTEVSELPPTISEGFASVITPLS